MPGNGPGATPTTLSATFARIFPASSFVSLWHSAQSLATPPSFRNAPAGAERNRTRNAATAQADRNGFIRGLLVRGSFSGNGHNTVIVLRRRIPPVVILWSFRSLSGKSDKP